MTQSYYLFLLLTLKDENSLESWKVLISKNLDAEEANRLYHSLLEEFKDKMVAQANLLQERYEKVDCWTRFLTLMFIYDYFVNSINH